MNDFGGMIPPQAIETEEVILGACMLEKEGFEIAVGILTSESFYKETNKVIFEAMNEIYRDNNPIDLITLVAKLREMQKLDYVGGPYALSILTNRISSSANTEFHCRIVQEKFLKRELIRKSTEIISVCYDESSDVFNTYDTHIADLMNLEAGISTEKVLTMSEIIDIGVERLGAIKTKGIQAGMKTPFLDLDYFMGGWRGGEFYIIAARPGQGKSVFAKEVARKNAIENIPTLVVNLEMSEQQQFDRTLSQETGIPLFRFRNGEMEDYHFSELLTISENVRRWPLYFVQQGKLNIIQLNRIVRKMVKERGIKMVIVDYLQLMDSGTDNKFREQEVSYISRSMKQLSKQFDIPVIALSQLSRATESRDSKRPQLSDLRESGSLEQDADFVGFIFRPESYGIAEIELEKDQVISSQGKATMIIAKNRQGKLTDIVFDFDHKTASFKDPNRVEESSSNLDRLSDIKPNTNF
jgi:replicative DNA helicase